MTAIESPFSSNAQKGLQVVGTSYYGLGGDASLVQAVQFSWDAAFVGTYTIWDTNYSDVALDSTAAGDWVQENPTSGYTAISPAGAATVGSNPLVLVVPGGTAGTAMMHLGNIGAHKLRTRCVCTTQGVTRIRTHGKE